MLTIMKKISPWIGHIFTPILVNMFSLLREDEFSHRQNIFNTLIALNLHAISINVCLIIWLEFQLLCWNYQSNDSILVQWTFQIPFAVFWCRLHASYWSSYIFNQPETQPRIDHLWQLLSNKMILFKQHVPTSWEIFTHFGKKKNDQMINQTHLHLDTCSNVFLVPSNESTYMEKINIYWILIE